MGGKATWTRFVPLKVGLLEHIETGEMTFNMFGVFVILLLRAKRDGDTGVVWVSAPNISEISGELSVHAVRRALEALKERGYLKSLARVGVRGRYPVVIANFMRERVASDGARQPEYLNASATTDWRYPVFGLAPQRASHGARRSASRPASQVASQVASPFTTVEPNRTEPEYFPAAVAPVQRKRQRRAPREPEKDPAPTGPLIEFWQTAEKVEGIQPHGSYGLHASVFRPLWEALGKDEEACRRAITLFLQCREPGIVKNGHRIQDFKYTLKRWIRAANGKVVVPTAAGFKSKSDRQVEAFQQSMQYEPGDHVPLIGAGGTP